MMTHPAAIRWWRYGRCARCEARPGEPCVNMTIKKALGGRYKPRQIRKPHPGRDARGM